MKRIYFWVGIFCVLYASLYLLGFPPTIVWGYVLDVVFDREIDTFYKIVPSEGSGYQALVACFIGVVLMVFSKFPMKKGL